MTKRNGRNTVWGRSTRKCTSVAQGTPDYTAAYSVALWFAQLLTHKDFLHYAGAYLLRHRPPHVAPDCLLEGY